MILPRDPATTRRARLRRKLAQLPVFPTLLTSGNLMCGVTAIFCATSSDTLLVEGAVLVFAAMFFDMLDGKVARLTRTEGEFGAELDSLADVVSFGVAPAMLVNRLVLGEVGGKPWVQGDERWIWLIVLMYTVFTAFRLARYNVESGRAEHIEAEGGPVPPSNSFRGLPSPGAAAFLCSWVLFCAWYGPVGNHGQTWLIQNVGKYWQDGIRWWLMGSTVVMAFLMVSRIRFPHFGNTMLGGHLGFRRLLLVVLMLAVAVTQPLYGLVIGTTAYILTGVIPGAWRTIQRWRRGRAILDEDDDDDEAPAASSS